MSPFVELLRIELNRGLTAKILVPTTSIILNTKKCKGETKFHPSLDLS